MQNMFETTKRLLCYVYIFMYHDRPRRLSVFCSLTFAPYEQCSFMGCAHPFYVLLPSKSYEAIWFLDVLHQEQDMLVLNDTNLATDSFIQFLDTQTKAI